MMSRSTISLSLLLSVLLLIRSRPISAAIELGGAGRYVASAEQIHVRYHMGPVLSSPIRIHVIWYGKWRPTQQSTIRDFLFSISDSSVASPSVREWWSTAALYFDQTGANVTRSISISGESSDPLCSHGTSLSRLEIQRLIAGVNGAAAVNPPVSVYLVLSGGDVVVEGFSGAINGFHFFTFPSIAGDTLPYAWVGKGDAGVDGMVSVIGHELAELATNPLGNSWYAGEDQAAPTEIVDFCASRGLHKVNGRAGRTFRVPLLWSPQSNDCAGPAAVD